MSLTVTMCALVPRLSWSCLWNQIVAFSFIVFPHCRQHPYPMETALTDTTWAILVACIHTQKFQGALNGDRVSCNNIDLSFQADNSAESPKRWWLVLPCSGGRHLSDKNVTWETLLWKMKATSERSWRSSDGLRDGLLWKHPISHLFDSCLILGTPTASPDSFSCGLKTTTPWPKALKVLVCYRLPSSQKTSPVSPGEEREWRQGVLAEAEFSWVFSF